MVFTTTRCRRMTSCAPRGVRGWSRHLYRHDVFGRLLLPAHAVRVAAMPCSLRLQGWSPEVDEADVARAVLPGPAGMVPT